MDYQTYKNLSFEQRTRLAKRLLLNYISHVLGQYSYEKVHEDELKKEDNSRTELDGLCKEYERRILVDRSQNCGFNQLRILMHEQIEALLGDKELFKAVSVKEGRKVSIHINHDKLDEVIERALRNTTK